MRKSSIDLNRLAEDPLTFASGDGTRSFSTKAKSHWMAKKQKSPLVKRNPTFLIPAGYYEFLSELKETIRKAQLKTALGIVK